MTIKLGNTVRDTITGYEGVVFGITNYLFGCKRVGIQGKIDKEGKVPELHWFDEPSLQVLKSEKNKKSEPSGGPRKAPISRKDPK